MFPLKYDKRLAGGKTTVAKVKPYSQRVYGHTRRNLIEFFGANGGLKTIREYDAEQTQGGSSYTAPRPSITRARRAD